MIFSQSFLGGARTRGEDGGGGGRGGVGGGHAGGVMAKGALAE